VRVPESLGSLVDHGILDAVLRPLMSGKEAQVYLTLSRGEQRVAKVYKAAQDRTFKHRAEYTEGRKVRNSRDQRAIESRSRHGRAQDEAAWRSAEVDVIYRLRDAGVRVPEPYNFIDGVLIMELVKDEHGDPAPRLGDLQFSPEQATAIFEQLLREVVRMLCAGVVHGDLSDFNVLMGANGPVIIDFPQAVNAAGNQNARRILLRDVANLQRFLERFAPGTPRLPYAEEMWQLYERNALSPDVKLSGRYRGATGPVNTEAVMSLVKDAEYEERRRREGLKRAMRGVSKPEHGGRGSNANARNAPAPGHQGQRPQAGATPGRQVQRPQAGVTPGHQAQRPQAGAAPGHQAQRPQAGATPGRQAQRPQAGAAPGHQAQRPHAGTTPARHAQHAQAGATSARHAQHAQAGATPARGSHAGAATPGAQDNGSGGATKRRRRRRRT
jgi:RIO kinase 1